MLDRLEAADGPVELPPDLGVLHRHVQRPLRAAELFGGQRDGGHVQGAVQGRGAVAGRADQSSGDPGELQPGQLPGLVQRGQRGPAQAAGVRGHREQRQPGVGGRGHQDQPGRGAVEHEALVPVQPPGRAVLDRGQPDRGRVPGAAVLGEGERRDGLAGGDVGQQPAPGPFVRAGQQGRGGQHGAGQVRPAVQRGAELLQHDRLLGEAEAGPAVTFRDGQALQPELGARLLPDGPVGLAAVHQLAHPGYRGPVRQETPDRGPELLLLRTHIQDHG